MNGKLQLVRPELHPVPVKAPWHHLGIDFVGPIAVPTPFDNCYILTCSDYCTKCVEAFATPTKSTLQTALALFKVRNIEYKHVML